MAFAPSPRFSPGLYISPMAGMSLGCRLGRAADCCSAGRPGVQESNHGTGSIVVIRRASGEAELRQVAQLRADAYYEDQNFGRFTASFKKQFQEQEYRRLTEENERICKTLICHEPQGEDVVGTLEIRPAEPEMMADLKSNFGHVSTASYIKNVVVHQLHRRKGIGKALLQEAWSTVQSEMDGCAAMLTHVEISNIDALRLYENFGFGCLDGSSVDDCRVDGTGVGVVTLLAYLPDQR
eukprot:jgi/Picsp_1/6757/NSC_04098-R1_protein